MCGDYSCPSRKLTETTSTTSNLAITPLVRCAGYSASKAALHAFILCLREQVQGEQLKIVELYPPAVQTELHDAKHQPDIKDGGKIGIPLEDFVNEAYAGLEADHDQIYVQTPPQAKQADQQRQEVMRHMWEQMKKMH
jgi:short-subunit dehydrogenase involved in D-alanine esterification of teichoic acids